MMKVRGLEDPFSAVLRQLFLFRAETVVVTVASSINHVSKYLSRILRLLRIPMALYLCSGYAEAKL